MLGIMLQIKSLHCQSDAGGNFLDDCGSLATFAGFLALEELYLNRVSLTTKICDCPGTNYSWVHYTDGNCVGRKNICLSTFSRMISVFS